MQRFKNIFLFYVLVLPYYLYGQSNIDDFDHYSVNEGLPTQTTYNLQQDRNGFLWIGTDEGVSRFDGNNFVNYTTEDGLGDNEILNVYEDKKGRVWFIPFSEKLSYYYNGKFHNEKNDPLLKTTTLLHTLNSLAEDHWGNIYGLGQYDAHKIIKIDTNNIVTILDLTDKIGKTNGVYTLHMSNDRKKVYFVTHDNRLFLLFGEASQEIKKFDFLANETIHTWFFSPKPKNSTLCVTSSGIYRVEDTTVKLLVTTTQLPFKGYNYYVTMDAFQNIWISHFQYGTFFLRYNNGKYLNAVHLLNDVFSITTFDNENNIWMCTGNQGLYKISYAKLKGDTTFDINHKLLKKNVLCMHTDAAGNLWLGYSNGYITRVCGQEVKHYNVSRSTHLYNRIIQIQSDRQGNIWCATDKAFAVIKKHKGIFSETQKPSPDNYFNGSGKGLCIAKNGDIYATEILKQFKIAENSFSLAVTYPVWDSLERKYSSFSDSRNRLYSSTASGLKLIEESRIINLAKNDKRLKVRINHFAENSHGIIFLATYSEGILALKENKVIATLKHVDGLGGIICRHVYLRSDTLYVATNGGLTIATFTNNKFTVLQNLTVSDGLPSNNINDIAFLGDILYAATSDGVAALKLPINKPQQVTPPVVLLLGFKVNETAFSFTQAIAFPYHKQRIRIEYIAPVMDKPENVLYRYRFSNSQKWSVTSSTLLELNDLPYGNYRLEIQAKRYNSSWSAIKEISFIITPPFYATWMFRILVGILGIALIYFLLKYIFTRRFRQQLNELKQKEAIEKERGRIAADIHDDIGSELTNIVLVSQILKVNTDGQSTMDLIGKLEASSNEVISKMNEVIWALNVSNDTLQNLATYLRNYINDILEKHSLKGVISFDDNIYIAHPLSADLRRNVFLVIKEVLHNIIKHSGAKEIQIKLYLDKHILMLEVQDNGKGFVLDKNFIGNGILNIKKRIAAINGEIEIISTPDNGCLIKAEIPLSKNNYE